MRVYRVRSVGEARLAKYFLSLARKKHQSLSAYIGCLFTLPFKIDVFVGGWEVRGGWYESGPRMLSSEFVSGWVLRRRTNAKQNTMRQSFRQFDRHWFYCTTPCEIFESPTVTSGSLRCADSNRDILPRVYVYVEYVSEYVLTGADCHVFSGRVYI